MQCNGDSLVFSVLNLSYFDSFGLLQARDGSSRMDGAAGLGFLRPLRLHCEILK